MEKTCVNRLWVTADSFTSQAFLSQIKMEGKIRPFLIQTVPFQTSELIHMKTGLAKQNVLLTLLWDMHRILTYAVMSKKSSLIGAVRKISIELFCRGRTFFYIYTFN